MNLAAADSTLQALAETMGILPRWCDLSGREQVTGPETQRALLGAMGLPVASAAETRETLAEFKASRGERTLPEELVVEAGKPARIPLAAAARWHLVLENGETLDGDATEEIVVTPPTGLHSLQVGDQCCLIIVAPPRTPDPMEKLAGRQRRQAWGLTAALYGLNSARSLGLGDYRDLANAAAQAAGLGTDFIGINPVHARGAASTDVSPYSPSCRTALEPRHIALNSVPGFDSCVEAQRLLSENATNAQTEQHRNLVDYRAHEGLHARALRVLFDHFQATQQEALATFESWRQGPGSTLDDFTLFEVLSLRHGEDWQRWPGALRSADSPAVAEVVDAAAGERRFHAWLQWLTEVQLAEAQATARSAGMAFGLYLDLAVGVRPGGADTWSMPGCFAAGVSLGAPPDAFNPAGQNWRLAPFNPHGLRRAAYGPFVQMLRSAMRHAGVLRIDHILGINRSFWVPEGGLAGGYVSYPMESLLALIRIEAQRSGCVVVGEDLGSVPEGLRDRLAAAGLLGCAVMQFEKEGTQFRAPGAYQPATLASFATHDTPTLRGWWSGWDVELRKDLGQITPEAAATAQEERRAERAALARLLAHEKLAPAGFDPEAPPEAADDFLALALHALLARSPSPLLAVQLDDALGIVEQQNLPGTIDEYPNWRRRYPVAVEALAAEPRLRALADLMEASLQAQPAKEEKQQWL